MTMILLYRAKKGTDKDCVLLFTITRKAQGRKAIPEIPWIASTWTSSMELSIVRWHNYINIHHRMVACADGRSEGNKKACRHAEPKAQSSTCA